MDAIDQLNSLLDSYQNILKLCYDALDAGASQEERDALRRSIESFVAESKD
jgi:hypothetical protein